MFRFFFATKPTDTSRFILFNTNITAVYQQASPNHFSENRSTGCNRSSLKNDNEKPHYISYITEPRTQRRYGARL